MSLLGTLNLTADPRGTTLEVRAQPNARRAGILGVHAGALRVNVTVAPEQGKAIAAVALVLAENLGCRTSAVVLVSGPSSRLQRFLILDLDPATVRDRLAVPLDSLGISDPSFLRWPE